MPHERSRVPIHVAGSTMNSLTVDDEPADHDPTCANRCASRGDAGALAHEVTLFLHDVEQSVPRHVQLDALGLLEGQPQRLQRLDDLDRERAHARVQAVAVDRVAQVDGGVRVTVADLAVHQDERVLHPPRFG